MGGKVSTGIVSSFLLLGLILVSLVQPVSAAPDAYTWALANISGAELRDWHTTASSADGSKLAAAAQSGYIYTSSDSGVTWTERTDAGLRTWVSMTSSADGTKLAATAQSGYIYTSSDSGVTWTEQAGSGQRAWVAIGSNFDGSKLIAATTDGYLYTSSDSGATWTERMNATGTEWASVKSSSDGTKLVAASTLSDTNNLTPGYIYTSSDSGVTWTQHQNGYWTDIASSSDGTKFAAVQLSANIATMAPGAIYTSSDSGATWTERTAAGARFWTSVSSSADGTFIAAVDLAADMSGTPGSLYVSADSGVSWEEQTGYTNYNWASVSSSSDGSRLTMVATANLFSGVGAVYVGTSNAAAPVTTFDFSTLTSTADTAASHAKISVNSSSTCASIDTSSSAVVGADSVTSPSSGVLVLGGLGFTLNCTATGGSADVTITLGTYYADTSVIRIYKSVGSVLQDITSAVTIGNEVVGGNNVTTVKYTLVDGGEYDSDKTANGVIVDPLYIGTTSAQTLANTGSDMWSVVYGAIALVAGGTLSIWSQLRRYKQPQG